MKTGHHLFAMGHDNQRFSVALTVGVEGRHHDGCRFVVKIGGRFIKQKNRARAVHRPRQQQALTLPQRQCGMAFADQGINPTGQAAHRLPERKRLQQCLNALLVALAVGGVKQGNVFAYGGVKQDIFLALQADKLRQLLAR